MSGGRFGLLEDEDLATTQTQTMLKKSKTAAFNGPSAPKKQLRWKDEEEDQSLTSSQPAPVAQLEEEVVSEEELAELSKIYFSKQQRIIDITTSTENILLFMIVSLSVLILLNLFFNHHNSLQPLVELGNSICLGTRELFHSATLKVRTSFNRV